MTSKDKQMIVAMLGSIMRRLLNIEEELVEGPRGLADRGASDREDIALKQRVADWTNKSQEAGEPQACPHCGKNGIRAKTTKIAAELVKLLEQNVPTYEGNCDKCGKKRRVIWLIEERHAICITCLEGELE